ncbi:MAG TPA: hypothetical protein VKE88_02485 [Candidatus Nanoarchaeia archaeon]|nr:hypothetical protein [Candidatus Nanoarchaeia archaeon]
MALQDIFYRLEYLGFTDVFLPFVLIFTIIYAVLNKINIFGTDSKRFNGIISLALSIGVIVPHVLGRYPPGTDVVQILNSALPNVSLLIVGIVFLLIVIGMFGGKAGWGDSFIGGAITLISLGLVVFIFGNSAGWWQSGGILSFLEDPDIQAVLLVVIVFGTIVSIITQEDKKDDDPITRLGKFFGSVAEAPKKDK